MRLVWAVLGFLAVAGTSSGQGSITCQVFAGTSIMNSLGLTEKLGNIALYCNADIAGANVRVILPSGTNLTSQILDEASQATEAMLLVDNPDPGSLILGQNVFQGVLISPTEIEFAGVQATGNVALTIRNLRANVSSLWGLERPISAIVAVTGNPLIAVNNPIQVVGVTTPAPESSTGVWATGGASNFQQCLSNNAALATNPTETGGNLDFGIQFRELIPNEFSKRLRQENEDPNSGKSGFYHPNFPPELQNAGLATQGTRLMAKFDSIPAGVTLFVTTGPVQASPGIGLAGARLVATDPDGAGAYSEVPSTSTIEIDGQTIGIAPLTVTDSEATAVWEILSSASYAPESVKFGVLVAYTANAASLADVGVETFLGPKSSVTAASSSAPVPRFANVPIGVRTKLFGIVPGCVATPSPTPAPEVSAAGLAGGSISVAGTVGCSWTAVSGEDWITVTGGASGSGDGTVSYTVAANSDPTARTGVITIAGVEYIISQRGAVPGAPVVSAVGIVNAASLLGGPTAPGEILALRGWGLGPATRMEATGSPWPTDLGGTRVLFNGVAAPLFSVSANEIVAFAPYGLTAGSYVDVEVEHLGVKSDAARVEIAPTAPGLLVVGSSGYPIGRTGTGAADAYDADGNLISGVHPAIRSETITLRGVGAGRTFTAIADGEAAPEDPPGMFAPATVNIGSYPATVESFTMAGGQVGVWELKTQVPAGVTPNAAVPVAVTVGSAQTQPGVTINVETTCTYSLDHNSHAFPVNGGTDAVTVTATDSSCPWSISSGAGWVTFSGASSRAGSGTVTLQAAANASGATRSTTVTIAGKTFTVTQGVAEPLRFVPMTPCRVVDTRWGPGPFGGPIMAGQSTRDFEIPIGPCTGIPANARAYSLNVSVIPETILSYLSIWPAGQERPFVSTLNSFDGRVKADAAIVPAGTNGAVSVFVTETSHVFIDINGYFVPEGSVADSLAFYPVAPCRVLDTRLSAGPFGGPVLPVGQQREIPVQASPCAIPAAAQAYSLNFTVVPQGRFDYLTTWPAGLPRPLVSTLNAFTGAVTANAAIVPAGTNGAISIFGTQTADVVIDINGYFAPPGAGGLSFYATAPCRVADTRWTGVPDVGAPSLTGTRTFSLPGQCGLPTAAAYSLNASVVPQGPLGYLTIWPAEVEMPEVSTLNSHDGTVVSNAAIVPATEGSINVFATQTTDLFLDVNGYFAP